RKRPSASMASACSRKARSAGSRRNGLLVSGSTRWRSMKAAGSERQRVISTLDMMVGLESVGLTAQAVGVLVATTARGGLGGPAKLVGQALGAPGDGGLGLGRVFARAA